MERATIKDIDVNGKRVLVRVDFNVPLDKKSGQITDDGRIKAALPTIQYLVNKGARVILASHLGRPDGKIVESMRMAPVAKRLSELIGKNIITTPDCVGPEVEKAASGLNNGDILLLENLRFHAEEEANTPSFAEALSRLAEIYVDDAFGTAHRKHASIVGVTRYLPAVAGFLMERELKMLGGLTANPAKPFAALLGGAKISDKVNLLDNIISKVDRILIGGGMAATFFKAKGLEIGQSLLEPDRIETANRIMNEVDKRNVRLLLPVDVVVANNISADADSKVTSYDSIPADMRIVDIGPRTVSSFQEQLKDCKTVFWNGPMGIYEIKPFAEGTRAMAHELADLDATTVIGGGSTADVVAELGLENKMTFVSTGGGASLALLGGEKLPGVEALLDKGSVKSHV